MAMRGRTSMISVFLALLLIAFQCRTLTAAPPVQSSAPGGSTTLKLGDPAPDFEVPDQNGKKVRLSDFKGKKNVVLAFYVLAFTGG